MSYETDWDRTQEIAQVLRELNEEAVEIAQRIGIEGLDGERCPQTLALYEALGAQGFALNNWWVMTEPNWICPACGRSKPEIARLDQHQRLMGKLVEHHDHMHDVLAQLFHDASSAKAEVVADALAKGFVKRAAPAISAYESTIICGDCNTSEGTAKKAAKADRNFSFSPGEIRMFVVPTPNQPHEINTAQATAIWQAREPMFFARMSLAKQLADIAASNEHWFQKQTGWLPPWSVELKATSKAQRVGIQHFREGYLYSTEKPRIDLSAWRRKKTPPAALRPTDSEIRHVAQVVAPNHWQATPEDWRCPVCERSKTEIVRPSNSNKWSFRATSRRTPFDLGSDADPVHLCGDCAKAAADFDKEAGARHSATIQDLRRIVRAQPHARHNFDNVEAERVLSELRLSLEGHFNDFDDV